ncbi:hypothetical protein [Saccharopolyspora pogona]|uniref:hypothetical protein n=1 Tax=Saccharopolyspora pogona TaxID=333966 RepID=UPI00168205D4|nr:hypothetical protein [Saccharopolyspora pogona]
MTIDTKERAAIQAAADRLLAGTPLRSDGELTVVQLAVEADVKRWLLAHKQRDLAEQFQARVRAARDDPPQVTELKNQIRQLEEDNARLRADNAEQHALTEYYAHIINELAAALDSVTAERDQLLGNVHAITGAASTNPEREDPAHESKLAVVAC